MKTNRSYSHPGSAYYGRAREKQIPPTAAVALLVTGLLASQLTPRTLAATNTTTGWEVTKTVVWGGSSTNSLKGSPQGTYDWKLAALAVHEHCSDGDDDPNHHQNTKQFSLTNNLSDGSHLDAECYPVEAHANIRFDCDPPVISSNKSWTITGSISGSTKSIVRQPDPKEQRAHAKAEGHMKITIGNIKSGQIRSGTNTIELPLRKDTDKETIGLSSTENTNGWHDPVQLQIREIETGRLFTEDLVHLDVGGVGAARWSWDTTNGLAIFVPNDGVSSLRISGSFPSAWIVSSPGAFTVQLSGGQFQATGSFANLPWVLSTNGGAVLSAVLPPADLPALRLAYLVPPGLLYPTNNYDETLSYDSIWESQAACCEGARLAVTPAPGGVLVSWPADTTNAILEQTDNLATPNWTPVPDAPVLVDGRLVIYRPAGLPEEFFRLRIPVVPCVLDITGQPADLTAVPGALIYFLVSAQGDPSPNSYQWQTQGADGLFTNIPGATDAAYVRSVTPADDGLLLRCIVGNGCASVPSAVATLTVQN